MKPITLRFLIPVALASVLVACAPLAPYGALRASNTPIPAEPVLYEWNDDGGPGTVSIHINRAMQRATYRRGERVIGWSYVATGRDGFTTPAGTFPISEKIVDKYSTSYGWIEDGYGNTVNSDAKPSTSVPEGCQYMPAPMPYWMRLTSYGIGMHAGRIPNPGYPASHGCIRLPNPLAPMVFDAVNEGTRVTVK